MLRPGRHLLIVLLGFAALICPSRAAAQFEEDTAPWLVEYWGEADLDEPFVFAADSSRADSAFWNLQATLRWRQDEPVPATATQSPFRAGPRLFLRSPRGLKAGLALDKDPGEARWDDHAAASLAAPLPENWGTVILGDYRAAFSQGLILRSGRRYGLGQETAGHLHSGEGLRPYAGWEEGQALRGAGVELRRGDFQAWAWGSSRGRDARVDSAGRVTSFATAGLHRTPAEESQRDACRETGWGARAQYQPRGGSWTFGGSVCRLDWDREVLAADEPLRRARNGSVDLAWKGGVHSVALEAAWDERGRSAQAGTLRARLPRVEAAGAIYRFAPDYFAPLAGFLDITAEEACNREGVYSALGLREAWGRLSGFVHLYRHPVRRPGASWGGRDLCLSGEKTLPHGEISLASRWVRREEPDSALAQDRWRGYATLRLESAAGEMESRLQLCRAPGLPGTGQMLRLGLARRFDLGAGLEIGVQAHTGIYRADDWALRLYWNDLDPAGTLRSQPVWGRGSLWQVSVHGLRPGWGRLAMTLLWDRPESLAGRSPSRTLGLVYRLS
ncbi:MAG: hypothetical protein C4524_14055 [Candidatus Zixiibacteriota bacterium]|nr:MAG: hypothetical protein C4524_14055 [candidate division Zixibacteria bacterium]